MTYRVVPPSGLALPDIHVTKEQAHEFFKSHYQPEGHTWYWLERIRPFKFSDFIPHSALAGIMKECMAEYGLDDSLLDMPLGEALEAEARAAVDNFCVNNNVYLDEYKMVEKSRVDA